MNLSFKEWLNNNLLLEFKSSNLYDFYALELAKDKIDSKELQDLLIDRGNALYQDILSAMGFVLFRRFATAAQNCAALNKLYGQDNSGSEYFLFPDDKDISKHDVAYAHEIKKEYDEYYEFLVNALENGVVRTSWPELIKGSPKNYKMWLSLSGEKQKNLVIFTRKLMYFYATIGFAMCSFAMRSVSAGWTAAYEFYINHMTDAVITNPNAIIKSVNELMQLVHNSGSLLEYMPTQLDFGLHVRDRASLPQLLSGASDSVREILRSASLMRGGLAQQRMPDVTQLLETAITRQISKYGFNHVSLINSYTSGSNHVGIYEFEGNFETDANEPKQVNTDPNLRKIQFAVAVMIPPEKSYTDPDHYKDKIFPTATLMVPSVKNSVLSGLTDHDWQQMKKWHDDLGPKALQPNTTRFDFMQLGTKVAYYAYEVKRTLNTYFTNKLRLGEYYY